MRITRTYEFDAGHRVMRHGGKCAHIHGHRYKAEFSLEGEVIDDRSSEVHAMVADFGTLKAHMEFVMAPFDHALVLECSDLKFLDPYIGDARNWNEALHVRHGDAAAFWRALMDKTLFPFKHDILNEGVEQEGVHRLVILPTSPTVEALAELFIRKMALRLDAKNIGWMSLGLRLFETPNCWADVTARRGS